MNRSANRALAPDAEAAITDSSAISAVPAPSEWSPLPICSDQKANILTGSVVAEPSPAGLSHSIVILSRDRPELLPRAVASALQAMGDEGELIVVDDGSRIPVARVLADFARPELRITRHQEAQGISAARNAGLAAAQGAIIFFLDDDDEFQPDYIRTVLSGPASQYDYGFSAYNLVGNTKSEAARPRFATGPVPAGAPLRRKICGMGMGFWIRADTARKIGPFATALRINEDIDYLCRLILSERRAWYCANAGVNIHHHRPTGRNSGNITRSVSAAERARDMRFVCDRYPQLAAHLGRSYLRHCAKAGLFTEARAYLRPLQPLGLRFGLTCYFHAKFVTYRLARRS